MSTWEELHESPYLHGMLKKTDLGRPEDVLSPLPVEVLGKEAELVDLTQPFGAGASLWPYFEDIVITRVHYHAKSRVLSQWINHPMHVTTHADSPVHVEEDYAYTHQIPLSRYIGKGVVVSVRKKKWEKIMPEDMEKVDPPIEENDIVIVNTGWHKFWGDNVKYFCYAPGFYKEVAEWFVKKKVKAVGTDTQALDHPLGTRETWRQGEGDKPVLPWLAEEYKATTGRDVMDDFPYWEPCHRILLTHGIVGYENVGGDIDKVTGQRCTIMGLPLRWVGGDGSIVRLVAIREKR